MSRHPQNRMTLIRVAVLVLFIALGGLLVFRSHAAPKTKVTEKAQEGTTKKTDNRAKYSSFPHSKHKQKCSACHKFPTSNWKTVREDAFPDVKDYPKHESCLSCHRRQFYAGPVPAICSICHSNPSPRNSKRRPFPDTGTTSDFAINFPHATHIEMMGANRKPPGKSPDGKASIVLAGLRSASEESCAVCHQTYQPQDDSDSEYFTDPPENFDGEFWLKKGAFKTAPGDHVSCFTCHSEETGILPAPDNCAACHKPKPGAVRMDYDAKNAARMNISDQFVLATWRTRNSSGTFRHEFSSHAEMDCSSCHNAAAMNTLDFATTKVDVLSCSICHITETSDDGGILNYEVDSRKADPTFQCVKCHVSFGKLAIPESHTKAISAQAGR